LSIILGNPYILNKSISIPSNYCNPNSTTKVKQYSVNDANLDSRATLIVVPSTLIGQWWREIQSRINKGNTKTGIFNCINLSDKEFRGRVRRVAFDVSPENVRPAFIENGDDLIENVDGLWGIANGMIVFASTLVVDFRLEGSDIIYRGRIASQKNVRFGRDEREIQIINHNYKFFSVDLQIDDYLFDHDIVLTNYESLRKCPSLYKKINWHRVVLDECQEIKISTNKIAVSCSMLVTKHRWMVSGTPLCSKIEDLHGELNFLKVIPFCLPDITDGFWLNKIGIPWKNRSKLSLKLLQSLISVVMMRHSKSQTYLDGRSLVPLLPRTIEWRGFDVTSDSELYILRYLEIFAADTMTKMLDNESSITQFDSNPHLVQLKSLLGIISRALTHPTSCCLIALDHLKRMLGSDRIDMIRHIIDSSSESIPILPADQVLEMLQQVGSGRDGGLNRSSNRTLTNTQKGINININIKNPIYLFINLFNELFF
jgi:SNF2 family DNA or RNA helicase